MRLKVIVEIETTEKLRPKDLEAIKGMEVEEAEKFLSEEFPNAEKYIRDELMLSPNDLVQITIKLEEEND